MILSFFAGLLGLGILSAAVQSPAAPGGGTVASNQLGSGFSWLASGIRKLVDPTVPAIANHASTSSSKSAPAKKASGSAPATSAPAKSSVNPPASIPDVLRGRPVPS